MIDTAEIVVRGGNGGDGVVSFLREKFRPRGGPDGGRGGRGGDLYILADPNLSTLEDFRRGRYFEAEGGGRGGPNKRRGRKGRDLVLKVPLGTEVWEAGEEKRLLADLSSLGKPFLAASGGAGGRGNAALRSSLRPLPKIAENGVPGEQRALRLELRLIADVGLVGLPNAGKSTFLRAVTAARPKVGDYPFTTLEPNLGVVSAVGDFGRRVVLADIPGLIKGAAEGKGLGDDFLRHVERTRILLHLIDPLSAAQAVDSPCSAKATLAAYQVIRGELGDYSSQLLVKPEIVVINKIDLQEVRDICDDIKRVFGERGISPLFVSAQVGEGLEELLAQVLSVLAELPKTEEVRKVPLPVFGISQLKNRRMVFRQDS